jgi:hypothetical protein
MKIDIDYEKVKPRTFEPLPAAWYSAEIVSAEGKANRSGDGKYLDIRYRVVSGPFSGRMVFGSVTTRNRNSTAMEIGREQIATIAEAIGVRFTDSDELIGRIVDIKLVITKSEQYGDKNEVRGWRKTEARPGDKNEVKGRREPAVSPGDFLGGDDIPF